MNIVKLTFEQKQLLDSQLIDESIDHVYFFTFQLQPNVWAISEMDQQACTNPSLQWLKELQSEEWIQPTIQKSGSI
jgi:hypothetical protein